MRFHVIKMLAGLAGFTGVALGALGAHGLKNQLSANGHIETWATAAHYHLMHAVALIALSALAAKPETGRAKALATSAIAWTAGILLFSGSLYGLALGGPRWLGPVTLLGGVAFLVGWGALLILPKAAGAAK